MVVDALHVGLDVIGQFDLLADADVLGAPVEIAEVHGNIGGAGNEVETGFPVLDGLAGPFRREGQMETAGLLHFLDNAAEHVGGIAAVYGNAAESPEEPAQGREEEILLDHALGLLAFGSVIQVYINRSRTGRNRLR